MEVYNEDGRKNGNSEGGCGMPVRRMAMANLTTLLQITRTKTLDQDHPSHPAGQRR